MKNYELTLILSSELDGEALNKIIQDIAAFIQEKGGLLKSQELRGKQRQGILALLVFSLNPEALESIQKKLKEEKQILRSMLTIAQRKRAETPTLQTAPKIAESEQPRMSVEDIDKKLEEIFKGQ